MLIIMTDDVGFAASSTFGGPIATPTFDALADRGLRYNRFHTTALCSPTRAALLTGRNHHAVNNGVISEIATGRPGYTGVIPDDAVTFGEVLKGNGYVTAFIGKNHNTPAWETGPSGPFDRWPNGFGFDYFFGFNGGETDQWAPALVENRNTVEPPTDDPTYILDRDLADRTINWLRTQSSAAPDKPFLVYYAPGRDVQYFEMFANRAIYDRGWMASTTPERLPWMTGATPDPLAYRWELYDLNKDFSQSTNLAEKYPEKLAEMKQLFEKEAARNNVLPVQASLVGRINSSNRPSPLGNKSSFRFYPSPQRYSDSAFPDIRNRSWKISARIDLTQAKDSGAVVTQGGRFGGWGLLMLDGKPNFVYRRSSLPEDLFRLESSKALPVGTHDIELSFVYDGGGAGKGGTVNMRINGEAAGSLVMPLTLGGAWPLEGATIGWDAGTPVIEDYRVPFRLNGIQHVDFDVGGGKPR
ncbi:MAG TPA: sulfatase-like hydrolase/transferase [Sphingopyxis sp.]|nr:sulfatase-like hydrolase/transferase [Sphingopyxis sp.]